MITFAQYNHLLKQSETRTMTGREHSQAAKFISQQPKKCPTCGVQVFDPFGFNRVIHDIAKCTPLNTDY